MANVLHLVILLVDDRWPSFFDVSRHQIQLLNSAGLDCLQHADPNGGISSTDSDLQPKVLEAPNPVTKTTKTSLIRPQFTKKKDPTNDYIQLRQGFYCRRPVGCIDPVCSCANLFDFISTRAEAHARALSFRGTMRQ